MVFRVLAIPIFVTMMLAQPLTAREVPAPRPIDYASEIKPLLTRRCYACHGALKQRSGLRLDTADAMRHGGDSGPAVVPGNRKDSLIVLAVTGRDMPRMPPESEGSGLKADEMAKMERWISEGAQAPADERPQPDPRAHWSFQPIKRPESPSGSAIGSRQPWIKSPIDRFLAAEHEQRGLTAAPAADPATLIRRVSLDLTGLLPRPEQVRSFVADPSDKAYQAIVDRLLASPEYGERWARQWMDVWRYSDWDGFGSEIRESQPHLWRWRDWIVTSLNQDAGYDQMIVAMLAADEAFPDDPQAARATGFLARNWYKFNRNVWLDDTVEHTAKAFLGITFNCAKCHDHKYDPIAQSDYYALRAFFEPYQVRTDRVPGQLDTNNDGVARVYDGDAAPTYVFQRGDEQKPIKDKPIVPSIPAVLQAGARLQQIRPVTIAAASRCPGLQAFIRDDASATADRDLMTRRAEWIAAERALVDAKNPKAAEQAERRLAIAKKALRVSATERKRIEAVIAADTAKFAEPLNRQAKRLAQIAARLEHTRDVLRAEEQLVRAQNGTSKESKTKIDQAQKAIAAARTAAQQDKPEYTPLTAEAAVPDVGGPPAQQDKPEYTPLTPTYPATSTGRRLALARWIADHRNPLTARVAVNQIWMRHFGTPLVTSVLDFGANGSAPTMPALLDWLAVRLMEEGWRMKPLHRLIVTSAAYRMASAAPDPAHHNLARDPSNIYYWRMNSKRMEAESVRDNVLLLGGTLDRRLGGADLDPGDGLNLGRRSLYFRHAKEKRVVFLRLFDSPNAVSCYRRSESVMPQQALAMANSSLCLDQARILAGRLAGEIDRGTCACYATHADLTYNGAFVVSAFERVLGRPPSVEERTECESYLDAQTLRFKAGGSLDTFVTGPEDRIKPATEPAQRARESLVHVLFNHNDFVQIR